MSEPLVQQLDAFRDSGPRVAAPPVPRRAPQSPQERFAQFHEANPQVYTHLVALARAGKAAGAHHLGIGMLFEELRWQSTIGTIGEEFKLNNNFRSHYARRIMAQEADLRGVFELRELSTSNVDK